MSDRVARLSALRRSRKSEKIIVNEGGPDERDSSTTGEKLNENELSTKRETITPSEATTLQEEATEEQNDQDTHHESKYDSAEATLSYNSDLKQDISLLLNKSQRATDNALKRIIQERFQEVNQI